MKPYLKILSYLNVHSEKENSRLNLEELLQKCVFGGLTSHAVCICVLEGGRREDAGETFTEMLYPVLRMDVEIEKGAEVSHGMTRYWKLCLTVKYFNNST